MDRNRKDVSSSAPSGDLAPTPYKCPCRRTDCIFRLSYNQSEEDYFFAARTPLEGTVTRSGIWFTVAVNGTDSLEAVTQIVRGDPLAN